LEKRRNAVLSAPVEFVVNGKPDDAVMGPIEFTLVLLLPDGRIRCEVLRHHALPVRQGQKGYITYDIIPRKHFDPIQRIIKARQTDITGLPY
jgi:hypothetical protein